MTRLIATAPARVREVGAQLEAIDPAMLPPANFSALHVPNTASDSSSKCRQTSPWLREKP